MGFHFTLEHASLVGWITRRDFSPPWGDPMYSDHPFFWEGPWHWHRIHHGPFGGLPEQAQPWRAPRVSRRVLEDFLRAVPDALLTRHRDFREELRHTARWCLDALSQSQTDRNEQLDRKSSVDPSVLPGATVARVLAPLRAWFSVPFYFLLLGPRFHSDEELAQTPEWTLWLRCIDGSYGRTQDLLDPFPAVRLGLLAKPEEDVTICWDWSGNPLLLRGHEAAIHLSREHSPRSLWHALREHAERPVPGASILQLSDLHFGTARAKDTLAYVEQHLRTVIDASNTGGKELQIVVTGDLMDTPSRANFAEFKALRNRLTDQTGSEVIVIPGNHDLKKKGTFWRRLEQAADLEWAAVVESDVSKFVFLCFDSSRDARLARGKITDDQFRDVATNLTELERRNTAADRIRIALVHHHPFSAREDEVDTLPFLGVRQEPFLRMENGDKLVEWCAKMNVPIVLHGHRHKPRYVGQEVVLENQVCPRLVRAIGCGTTLGAEGKPLSYNLVTWQPEQRTWMVSFFADPGDGSGFVERRLVAGSLSGAA